MAKHKKAWFVSVRGSYLPSSLTGLVLYLAYAAYIVLLAIGWYADGHRIWYLLVNVIPLAVGAAVLTQYIASKHSE
jgi:hypothetical protein